MNDALELLQGTSDSQKLAGLLVAVKVLGRKTDPIQQRELELFLESIYESVGSLFLRRLFHSKQPSCVHTACVLLLAMALSCKTLAKDLAQNQKLINSLYLGLHLEEPLLEDSLQLVSVFTPVNALPDLALMLSKHSPDQELFQRTLDVLQTIVQSHSSDPKRPLFLEKCLENTLQLFHSQKAQFMHCLSVLEMIVNQLETVPQCYAFLQQILIQLLTSKLDSNHRMLALQLSLTTLKQFPLEWSSSQHGNDFIVSLITLSSVECQLQLGIIHNQHFSEQLVSTCFEILAHCLLQSDPWDNMSHQHVSAILRRLQDTVKVTLEYFQTLEHDTQEWTLPALRMISLFFNESNDPSLEILFEKSLSFLLSHTHVSELFACLAPRLCRPAVLFQTRHNSLHLVAIEFLSTPIHDEQDLILLHDSLDLLSEWEQMDHFFLVHSLPKEVLDKLSQTLNQSKESLNPTLIDIIQIKCQQLAQTLNHA